MGMNKMQRKYLSLAAGSRMKDDGIQRKRWSRFWKKRFRSLKRYTQIILLSLPSITLVARNARLLMLRSLIGRTLDPVASNQICAPLDGKMQDMVYRHNDRQWGSVTPLTGGALVRKSKGTSRVRSMEGGASKTVWGCQERY